MVMAYQRTKQALIDRPLPRQLLSPHPITARVVDHLPWLRSQLFSRPFSWTLQQPVLPSRMAPAGALEARMADGLAALELDDVTARVHDRLPNVLEQLFPAGPMGTPDFYAATTLAFAVRAAAIQARCEPALQTFLEDFGRILEDAAQFSLTVGTTEPEAFHQNMQDLMQHYVVPRLQGQHALLFQGGYQNFQESHACDLFFFPTKEGETLCGVVNRRGGENAQPHDAMGNQRALVIILKTAALTGPQAATALGGLLKLQYRMPDEVRCIEDFYAAVDQLRLAAEGRVVLGYGGDNEPIEAVDFPAQSPQKAGTCAMSALLGAMLFAMHAYFHTYPLDTSAAARATVRCYYKNTKALCRMAVLQQAIDALTQARKNHDGAYASKLTAALVHVRAYLQARADKPHKLTEPFLAALRGVGLQPGP